MKVGTEDTPSSFTTIQCLRVLDERIKVFKNEDSAGNVFYHVSYEPPIEEIESPSDIEVLAAFTVASDETPEEVKEDAISYAREQV